MVDSLLAATPVTSPRYPEVLFTRASLSATAAQAERDYRRLFVEFPLSPRAADALLRLAQLEIARGDRALALKHLERLTREHPGTPALPRANYWLARVRFESGDTRNGCAALDAARAAASPGDVELRNQIAYYAGRCGVQSAAPAATARAATAPATETAAAPPLGAPAASATPSPPASPASPSSSTAAAVSPPPAANAVPTTVPPAAEREPVREPAREPPREPPSVAAPSPAAPRSDLPRAEATGEFSVQVAAFDTRGPAEQLARKLQGRGYGARVAGAGAPYRVRIGRYRTHAEAAAAAQRLRAQSITTIVVESEPR